MDRDRYRQWLVRASAAHVACTCIVAYYIIIMLDDNEPIPREPSIFRDLLRNAHMGEIFVGGATSCVDYLRMAPNPFFNLARLLRERNLLKDTIHVSTEEQLLIFLHIVGHNRKNKSLRIDSSRSGETISRYFNQVLHAICQIRDLFVRQPGYDIPVEITSSPSYYPWFKDCMGLIDGTHIKVSVPKDIEGKFVGRKGGTTQNVLAAALPNKQFTYVLAGWEGSASDFTVLKDALSMEPPEGLRVLPGKYYLCDAGYTTMPGFIAPYRSVPYHLEEQHGNTPKNPKELFNLRHASLRSNIESAFGTLKNRFKILCDRPFYPLESQIDIVLACCVIHNYILQVDPEDYYLNNVSKFEEGNEEEFDEAEVHSTDRSQRELNRIWVEKRDDIAEAMWAQYCDNHNQGGGMENV